MKKSRKTKRALIPSILAVIMCVAMLVGTTFAWFTDTASTSVNKIQAGELDVALQYATAWDAEGNPTEWESAEGETLSFLQKSVSDGKETVAQNANILWEPGCTYDLPELKIVNNENLDLKYKILVTGINSSSTDVEDLNSAIVWTMELDETTEELGMEHKLLAAEDDAESANIFTISGHMKETAGNEYQGLSIDGIAITVYATQLNSEFDSFDSKYDEGALYPLMPKVDVTATKSATVDASSALKTAVEMTASTIPAGTVLYTDHSGSTGNNNTVAANSEGKLKEEVKTTAASANEMTISINYTYVTTTGGTETKTEVKGFSKVIEHTFPLSKGLRDVTVTHGNATTAMTKAADMTAYNADGFEGSYYDSTTGTLYIKSSTYSDFKVVIDHGFVASVNGQGYIDFDKAVEAAGSEGTVVLVSNLTKDIVVTGTLNLNLGGQTITNAGDSHTITVSNGANLTISGSGTVDNTKHGKAAIYNSEGGTVTLKGGTYTRSQEKGASKTDAGGNSYYTIENVGTMTIESGASVINSGHFSSMIRNGYGDGSGKTNTPTLTINGGTFSGGINTIKNDDCGKLTINNGTFSNFTQSCVQNHHIAEIKGGTYNPSGDACAVINCCTSGCTAEKVSANSGYIAHQLTISGGVFNGDIKQSVGTVSLSGDYILNGELIGDIDVELKTDNEGAYLISSAGELRSFAKTVNADNDAYVG